MSRSGWPLPYGAQLTEESGQRGARFRVAAPGKTRIEVALADARGYQFVELANEGDGNFSRFIADIAAGARYKFRIDGDLILPDPYTRYQPDDAHGDSQIIDPCAYQWRDDNWRGIALDKMIIYELHVGAFTPAGTFAAIIDRLDYLLKLGINAIELMPLADFPGRCNWGYDGVQYFAPDSAYGSVDDLKSLIDAAHQHGIAVIIDVVYNHFGPDGNYLWSYSRDYFTARHKTPWGDAPNFDSEHCELMRTYVQENALFWINEYHADGLRMDATFAIIDDSPRHILAEIAANLHAKKRADLPITLIAEDHRNLAQLNWPQPQGFGFDAQWVDDFHHAIHCYFTGENDGYYKNYQGSIDEIVKAYNDGFLYQGEQYESWQKPRGTRPERLRGDEMIVSIQNHDQIGNRAFGERLNEIIDRDAYHLAVALLLLSPFTPMLFMGQEYAAQQPFLFFTNHKEDLGRAVTKGRREEFKDFAIFAHSHECDEIPDPQAETTFQRSQLHLEDHNLPACAPTFRLHQRLIALIKNEPALSQRERARSYAFSPAGDIFALLRRARAHQGNDFFALANLGKENLSLPIEKLASVLQQAHELQWHSPLLSTLAPEYGGNGLGIEVAGDNLLLPGRGLWLYRV
jgi:maltooligosyltrehalose trehalohydrolase